MSAIFHTTHGDIEISLLDIYKTPKSAKNFLALCASNYYNECLVHRSIKGFIMQTGDPTNTGNGGESIYETVTVTRTSKMKFIMNSNTKKEELLVGQVKEAIPTALNSSSHSQSRSKNITRILDKKYTVFGKVTGGHDVLTKIENEPVNENDQPLNQIKILDVTVTANPIADMEA